MSVQVIATNDNITIVYNKETIQVNRKKNAATFEQVMDRVHKQDVAWIEKNFTKIKSDLEMMTNGHFTVVNGVAVLKGTTIAIPDVILKKLMELEKESEPILPLLKFWRKLSQNPSEDSRKDLYGFMIANNIPITEEGDIVTEKGVTQKVGGFPGDLLDKHSRTIDNSIGNFVQMPREKVNPNRNETCSFGLHVGAPDYVRDWYKNDIIVECIVNPKDVVTVPTDYKNTKMRVCAYRVAGYSSKTSRSANKVVKLNEFLAEPIAEQTALMEKGSNAEPREKQAPATKGTVITKTLEPVKEQDELDYDNMSAKAIVDYIKKTTGEEITFSLKSKQSIVKKAKELLEVHKIKNNG